MLERELLCISENAPLSPARAAGLVGSCPGAVPAARDEVPFSCAEGRARGLLLGQPALGGPWVCAIGAFDGFHLGHQALLARARTEAEALGARVCAVTFSPDPAEALGAPVAGSRLVAPALRPELLLDGDADAVLDFDFDAAFARLSYDEFVRDALLGMADVRGIVVGSDFRMGAKGAGDVDALRRLGDSIGIRVVGLELVDEGGRHITATRIRGLVRAGRVEAAAGLMGRCLCVGGLVAHGRGEGSTFGFPTANVLTDAKNCVPEQGVYACYVVVAEDGRRVAYPAAVNVGAPPSFEAGAGERAADVLLEANLIGYSGDLYGSEVSVAFVRWLRDSRRFDSLDELKATVLGNIAWVRDCLGDAGIALKTEEVPR